MDLEAEGQPLRKEQVEAIHAAKTGALLSTSVWLGAYLGGASESDAERVRAYGRKIGLAFQIMDDILDETESAETLGKTAGKDVAQQKATYPSVFGLERSHQIANDLSAQAISDLDHYAGRADRLRQIARFLLHRRT